MKEDWSIDVSVQLSQDESLATVRIQGRSCPIVVPVLGVDRNDGNQISHIYLSSRIHKSKSYYRGWNMSGAVSTILSPDVIPPE